jgi:hypothetical protein
MRSEARRTTPVKKVDRGQIKTIHTLKGKLGLDDDTYRAVLSTYGVESSTALTWRQAEDLIADLRVKAGQPADRHYLPRKRHADMDGRPSMATGAQCRLLEAMWSQVSRAEPGEAREKAFNKFIKRIVGVEALRFVRIFDVERIVKALEGMGATKED